MGYKLCGEDSRQKKVSVQIAVSERLVEGKSKLEECSQHFRFLYLDYSMSN